MAKPKASDCVDMKDRIQAKLWAEYQRRRGEFRTYMDFIRAKNDESEWVKTVRARFGWN